MTKIQLTLTSQEADILSVKAAQLGYNLTRYIKLLISKEAENTFTSANLPTFPMSKELETIGLQALKDHQAGKTISFESIDELFEA